MMNVLTVQWFNLNMWMSSDLLVLFYSYIHNVFDEFQMNLRDPLTFQVLACQRVSQQSHNAPDSEFGLKCFATNYLEVTLHSACADKYELDTIVNYLWTNTRSSVTFRAACCRCTKTTKGSCSCISDENIAISIWLFHQLHRICKQRYFCTSLLLLLIVISSSAFVLSSFSPSVIRRLYLSCREGPRPDADNPACAYSMDGGVTSVASGCGGVVSTDDAQTIQLWWSSLWDWPVGVGCRHLRHGPMTSSQVSKSEQAGLGGNSLLDCVVYAWFTSGLRTRRRRSMCQVRVGRQCEGHFSRGACWLREGWGVEKWPGQSRGFGCPSSRKAWIPRVSSSCLWCRISLPPNSWRSSAWWRRALTPRVRASHRIFGSVTCGARWSSQCHSGHGRARRVVDHPLGKAAYMEWSMRLVSTNKVSLDARMPLWWRSRGRWTSWRQMSSFTAWYPNDVSLRQVVESDVSPAVLPSICWWA